MEMTRMTRTLDEGNGTVKNGSKTIAVMSTARVTMVTMMTMGTT
jgi:hypothetical protein